MSTSHSNGGGGGGVNAIKKERTHHSPLGTGLPKKGGAGGKGTWGKGGLDDLTTGGAAVDSNDPNYCSEDEVDDGGVDVRGGGGKQRPDVKVYSLGVDPLVAIIQEHLLSADLDDTANSLKEVKPFTDTTFEQFVKKAIVTSMEHHAYERELISKLLSKFYNEVIPSEKITDGFQACLNQIDDIVLDNPDAPEVLAKFLARAIVDEIIAPAFLTHAKVSSPRAEEVLATASGLVTEKHRIDRLAHIWGPGDLSSVKRLKQEVDLLLREFLTNGDMDEADKSVRKLNAPSFHFQVIKQAVRIALQLSVDDKKKLSKLLVFFHDTGLVTSEHCERGFRATYAALKDISLDIPNAEKMLAEFVDIAKEDGYLSKDFQP